MICRIVLILLFFFSFECTIHANNLGLLKEVDVVQLSIDLLVALKDGEDSQYIEQQLSDIPFSEFQKQIQTDQEKLSFWINIYNAYILIVLNEHPSYYEDKMWFFKQELIPIAGTQFSFNDIEHGIIRKSQLIFGMGYLRNPFESKVIKKLRVKKRDYRIHFALNCGAQSCPPIAIYSPDTLEEDLNTMALAFLERETRFDKEKHVAYTTSIVSWFRGDFGGKKGIRSMLLEYGILPSNDIEVRVTEYDWTLFLNNFVELSDR